MLVLRLNPRAGGEEQLDGSAGAGVCSEHKGCASELGARVDGGAG